LRRRRRFRSPGLRLELGGVRDRVFDVEEGVAVQPDRHERRLDAGKHAVDASEVNVADEGLTAPPLVHDLHDTAVFQNGNPRLGRRRVDEELFPHALANRRYSTPRIRPIPRKVVATDEPPYETRGSGMPVVGARPIIIAALMMTEKNIMPVRPR